MITQSEPEKAQFFFQFPDRVCVCCGRKFGIIKTSMELADFYIFDCHGEVLPNVVHCDKPISCRKPGMEGCKLKNLQDFEQDQKNQVRYFFKIMLRELDRGDLICYVADFRKCVNEVGYKLLIELLEFSKAHYEINNKLENPEEALYLLYLSKN